MSEVNIGVARTDITPRKNKLQFVGFADPRQKSNGVLDRIYSRAFYFSKEKKDLFIVVADIWSCTKLLKEKVIEKVNQELGQQVLTAANLMLSGNHTHSAPGGYSGHRLYNQPDGPDRYVIMYYRDSIATSILEAYRHAKPGHIYIGNGEVQGCGIQRSPDAYNSNPQRERKKYGADTDKSMTLLRLTHIEQGVETEVGMINWHAVHTTDMGQTNKLISGDNKGEASRLFEDFGKNQLNNNNYVAAFANANCGDVTGTLRKDFSDGSNDEVAMKRNGKIQFEAAKVIYNGALTKLSSDFESWYRTIDMSRLRIKNTHNRTWPYALGISFTAGSMEDSLSVFGCIAGSTIEVGGVKEGLKLPSIIGTPYEITKKLYETLMAPIVGSLLPVLMPPNEIKGHYPKPIVLAPRRDEKIVPSRLPIQIFRIGELSIMGVPGEMSTMAGRRLKVKLLSDMSSQGVEHIAVNCYANDYCQYTVTRQEYNMQQYEGASTAFGPHTLDAYIQEFSSLLKREDQYIDCENRSSFDVKFEITALPKSDGAIYKMIKSVPFFRFSLPSSIGLYRIRAHYKKRKQKWKKTAWLTLESMGVGSAVHICFEKKKVKNYGQIYNKVLRCSYSGDEYVDFICSYRNRRSQKITKHSKLVISGFYDFKIPWNATKVDLYATIQPEPIGPKKITQKLDVDISSHEQVYIEFKNGRLVESERIGPWW